jgi:hypothetical protein
MGILRSKTALDAAGIDVVSIGICCITTRCSHKGTLLTPRIDVGGILVHILSVIGIIRVISSDKAGNPSELVMLLRGVGTVMGLIWQCLGGQPRARLARVGRVALLIVRHHEEVAS